MNDNKYLIMGLTECFPFCIEYDDHYCHNLYLIQTYNDLACVCLNIFNKLYAENSEWIESQYETAHTHGKDLDTYFKHIHGYDYNEYLSKIQDILPMAYKDTAKMHRDIAIRGLAELRKNSERVLLKQLITLDCTDDTIYKVYKWLNTNCAEFKVKDFAKI